MTVLHNGCVSVFLDAGQGLRTRNAARNTCHSFFPFFFFSGGDTVEGEVLYLVTVIGFLDFASFPRASAIPPGILGFDRACAL